MSGFPTIVFTDISRPHTDSVRHTTVSFGKTKYKMERNWLISFSAVLVWRNFVTNIIFDKLLRANTELACQYLCSYLRPKYAKKEATNRIKTI